jgi:hypothetical protein
MWTGCLVNPFHSSSGDSDMSQRTEANVWQLIVRVAHEISHFTIYFQVASKQNIGRFINFVNLCYVSSNSLCLIEILPRLRYITYIIDRHVNSEYSPCYCPANFTDYSSISYIHVSCPKAYMSLDYCLLPDLARIYICMWSSRDQNTCNPVTT